MAPSTVPDLLAGLLREDPARPLVTFYDGSSGERTELSVTSFENWVAKTANLLQNELDAEPGTSVAIWLPTHWLAAVWSCAVAACGVRVGFDAPGARQPWDVIVCGPDGLRAAVAAGADHVVALSLQPLATRFGDSLPSGAVDYAAQVLGEDDVFQPLDPPRGETEFVVDADGVRTQTEVLEQAGEQARRLGVSDGARLLTDANPASRSGLVTGLLAPMVAGGSVVLVRDLAAGAVDDVAHQERVTVHAVRGAG